MQALNANLKSSVAYRAIGNRRSIRYTWLESKKSNSETDGEQTAASDSMQTLETFRVLIAEDQALVRQGMAALLSEHTAAVIEVDNGKDALDRLKSENIDLALLDIGLPQRTGLDVLAHVRKIGLDLKIIILTGDTQSYSPKQIYAAGADAFLYKTADASHFLETCESVASGAQANRALSNEGSHTKEIAQLKEDLSDRELQIVKLIVEGMSNKQAAEVLFISEHTVRKHREHINQKLSINSPLALASFAIKAGLV